MAAKQVVVFEAGKITYDVVSLPGGKAQLKALQGHVGGHIELLPHKKGSSAQWTGYANEEGILENLPSNFVAWGTLQHLGFADSSLIPGAYAGNIVLMGKNGKGLTEKQLAEVKAAYDAYKKEIVGSEEEEEEEEKEEDKDKDKVVDKVVVSGLKKAREETGEEDGPEKKKPRLDT